jgi:hypothetical protein
MLEGVVIDDTELFNDRLQEWRGSATSTGFTGASGPDAVRDAPEEERAQASTDIVSCTLGDFRVLG